MVSVKPLCPIFGECGGCSYQDVSYEEELAIKKEQLKELIDGKLSFESHQIDDIVASPKEYHYRHRLDLRLQKTKDKRILIGFTPKVGYGMVLIDECAISREEVSKYIAHVKKEAIAKLPEKYYQANLVIRTGDDGRVFWGGIGKRSLNLAEEDYLWTELRDKRIHYSLESFFQANLSILPKLFDVIEGLPIWKENIRFLDLYGGVGLFSLGLSDLYKESYLIDNNRQSIAVARYNLEFNDVKNCEVYEGRVEDLIKKIYKQDDGLSNVAMIDPPRAGLSKEAREFLTKVSGIKYMLYLSCNPEALLRDLKAFEQNNWNIENIIPFDFFPKTKHLETLVLMKARA